MSRTEALIGESPLVRAHMRHLQRLHGVYEAALIDRALAELGITTPEEREKRWEEVKQSLAGHLGRAAAKVGGPVPAFSGRR